jgi:hypothetical protein
MIKHIIVTVLMRRLTDIRKILSLLLFGFTKRSDYTHRQSVDKMRDRYWECPSRPLLLTLILVAFALRMYRLAQPPLSWDEGWSIGLSTLSWAEINRITALDVHPPLYYDVFKLWLSLGQHELWIRFLSVIAGVVTVPIAYATGRIWTRTAGVGERGEQVGVLAAFVTTLSPFLLYYSQVARMFSLCAGLSLLATYFLLKAIDTDRFSLYAAFVLSATAAMYTFYYTAFALIAVFVYALLIRPGRSRALLISASVIALLYVPWLWYAVPPMLERVGSRTGSAFSGADTLRLLADGVFGLVFAYGAGWIAVYVILLLLIAAVFLAWRRQQSMRYLMLPLLAIVLSLVAVSVGAKAHMFAARYLISASPFLALLIAWAIDVCWQRTRWLGVLGLLLLVASTFPTVAHYVYVKSYEVSGAFDPQANYRYLQDKTATDDVVFFNVLSLAGHYERLRTVDDPAWSYVLRWDPVIEPLEPALTDRVQPAATRHRRLWFVLYKGTVAANLPLKEWLDLNLFPAFGQWRDDTLYLQYLSPTTQEMQREPRLTFDNRILLQAVAFTSHTQADDRVTVRLTWSSTKEIAHSYKVFVHLYTTDGRLVTQHDSVPVNELRPTWSWQPGEEIIDNHGLWVPADVSESLRLVVGLYDPESNTRLTLPDGSDHADVGVIEVVPGAVSSLN